MTMTTGFDLCRAAMTAPGVTAPERSVLMVLAIMANTDAQCWPPINDSETAPGLTSRCVLSERAVQRAVQQLVKLGHISRRQLRHGVVYTVHPKADAVTPATQTGVSETPDTPTPDSQPLTPATQAPKLPETTISSDAEASSDRDPVPVARVAAKRRWPRAMPPPVGVSDDQWAGFVSHRLGLRKPLTDRAYDLLIAKLKAEASDVWPPGRIVDEMVERGWLSFKMEWLTKADNRNVKRPHQYERPSGWAPRPGNEGAEPAYLDD